MPRYQVFVALKSNGADVTLAIEAADSEAAAAEANRKGVVVSRVDWVKDAEPPRKNREPAERRRWERVRDPSVRHRWERVFVLRVVSIFLGVWLVFAIIWLLFAISENEPIATRLTGVIWLPAILRLFVGWRLELIEARGDAN